MESVFYHLFNFSINAGWLVIAVLILRLFLKKAPRWLVCSLWALVGVRLIFPFSIESVFSLIPSAQTVPPDIVYESEPAIDSGISSLNDIVNPIIGEYFAPKPMTSINPLQALGYLASYVWLIGLCLMVGYMLFGYLRLRYRLRTATKREQGVFESENVSSPFILGVFRPRIYLPYGLDDETFFHVISHERAHLARRDYLIKPFAFLLLSVYWFQPLLWVAYVLLCRDIEYACDEKVIKNKNEEYRREYSMALLACSIHRRSIAACPLAFGEVGVKGRVKNVMNYRKPAFWIILLAVIAIVVTAVCFLTNPVRETSPLQLTSVTTTGGAESVSVTVTESELSDRDLQLTLLWDTPIQTIRIRQAVLYQLLDEGYTLCETIPIANGEVSPRANMSHKITLESLEAGTYRLEVVYEIPSTGNSGSVFVDFTLDSNFDSKSYPPMYYAAEKIVERNGTHYSDIAYVPYFYIDEGMNLYEKRKHYITGSIYDEWKLCGTLEKLEQTLPNVEVWAVSYEDEYGKPSERTFTFYENGKVQYTYVSEDGQYCVCKMGAVPDMAKQFNVISVESLREDVEISYFGTEIAYKDVKLMFWCQNNSEYFLSHQGHEYGVDENGEHVVRVVNDVRLEKKMSDGWMAVEYISPTGWGMASGGGITPSFRFGSISTSDGRAFENGIYRLTFTVNLMSEAVDSSDEDYEEKCVERNVPCAEIIFEIVDPGETINKTVDMS